MAVPLFSLRTASDWGIGEIPDLVPLAMWAGRMGQSIIQLLPINETIGLVHEVHEGEGYQKVTLIPGLLATIDKGKETAESEGESHGEEVLYGIIPFFRGPSTDLNFTASLAIITMIVVQIVGE